MTRDRFLLAGHLHRQTKSAHFINGMSSTLHWLHNNDFIDANRNKTTIQSGP